MGRDVKLNMEQFIRARAVIGNAPIRSIGEGDLLFPLFKKLTLTTAEEQEAGWREITQGGQVLYQYNPQVIIARHFSSKQVNAFLSLIITPPETVPWHVAEWALQQAIRRELGDATMVEPDDDEDDDNENPSAGG